MKILVVAPTPFFAHRGTHIRILEEALALEKLGHEITIAAYHNGEDIHSQIQTNIEVRRIWRLLFWYKKLEAGPDWQKILLDLLLIRKVFSLTLEKKPDIIHGHLHEGVLIGWIVQKLLFWKKIRLVADFHGSLVGEMESHGYLSRRFLKGLFGLIEKFVDKLGDYAITSSWENTEFIKKMRKQEDIATVLDGVNLESYLGLPSKEGLRRDLELPLNKNIVVYAGALIENKGIKFLLEAIKIALQKSEDIYFIVAGFPAEGVEKFIQENKFGSNVRLVSPLSYFDMPKLLAASDVGVDPKESNARQASGKILQYMAAGLPVVCFDRKNNREYLDGGAYYASSASGQGIADEILLSMGNPIERETRGRINAERIIQFSWARSAEKIDKIYHRLISDPTEKEIKLNNDSKFSI